MCFFLKIYWFFWTLPVLLQHWFSTCLVCVHTLTTRENRDSQSPEYFKILGKKTIFNEHPVLEPLRLIIFHLEATCTWKICMRAQFSFSKYEHIMKIFAFIKVYNWKWISKIRFMYILCIKGYQFLNILNNFLIIHFPIHF